MNNAIDQGRSAAADAIMKAHRTGGHAATITKHAQTAKGNALERFARGIAEAVSKDELHKRAPAAEKAGRSPLADRQTGDSIAAIKKVHARGADRLTGDTLPDLRKAANATGSRPAEADRTLAAIKAVHRAAPVRAL